MYQDKLASLKELMKQLENGTHIDLVRRVEKAKQMREDRDFLTDVIYDFEVCYFTILLPWAYSPMTQSTKNVAHCMTR